MWPTDAILTPPGIGCICTTALAVGPLKNRRTIVDSLTTRPLSTPRALGVVAPTALPVGRARLAEELALR